MASTSGPRVPANLDDFRKLAGARLSAFPRIEIPETPGIRRAAVLLCVAPQVDGPLAVIVIKRAYRGRNAGQWGLPGGRLDDGETLEQAGVRELHEELGLTVSPDALLGRLDDFPAASGFSITPFVAVLEDLAALDPSPDEVHSVHLVDLERLAADDVPHWVRPEGASRLPDSGDAAADDSRLLQMRLGPTMTIHAPTGAMLWQFREVVLLDHPAAAVRVAHFHQPVWTNH